MAAFGNWPYEDLPAINNLVFDNIISDDGLRGAVAEMCSPHYKEIVARPNHAEAFVSHADLAFSMIRGATENSIPEYEKNLDASKTEQLALKSEPKNSEAQSPEKPDQTRSD